MPCAPCSSCRVIVPGRLAAKGSLAAVGFVSLCLLGLLGSGRAIAAITTVGNVTPTPPVGGGNVVGAFVIGSSSFGSVDVAGGTALTSSSSATIGDLAAGVGVVTLNGLGSNWTLTSVGTDVTIGDVGIGSMSLSNRAIFTVPDDSVLGNLADSVGSASVSGLGTIYQNGDDLTVGNAGRGQFVVSGGGRLNSDATLIGDAATGNGVVTISGEFSRWANGTSLIVGDTGRGRLNVHDGGRVTSASATLGDELNSSGVAEVSGTLAQLQLTGALVVGNFGEAALRILDGGRVTTGQGLSLAPEANSYAELLVDGVDSRLEITGALATGLGDAHVIVSNGAALFTTTASVIQPTASIALDGGRWNSTAAGNAISVSGLLEGQGIIDAGTVAVSGSRGRLFVGAGQRLLLTGSLNVTSTGSGALVDLNGGELEVRNSVSNSFNIDARNGATLRMGGSGLDNNLNSQLAITGGAVDVFGDINNNAGAEIVVMGGGTAIFHDAVTNNGTIFVSAGSDIALLENLGFTPSAAFTIELAQIAATAPPTDAFGLADIAGTATLAGELSVELISGFTPLLGDTFEVLRASGGVTGSFTSESLPALGGGLALDVQYTTNSVLLAVVTSPQLADFDGDGDVDANDFSRWQDGFGTASGAAQNQGDADRDGDVDGGDFLAWQSQFGGAAANVAATAVPEPQTAAIIAASWLCAVGVRKRRSL